MAETSKSIHRRREAAESIAVSALGFLAADPAELEAFLSLSGLDPHDIRAAAQDPGFLAGVLQHMLADEKRASAFALESGLGAEELAMAAHLLEQS